MMRFTSAVYFAMHLRLNDFYCLKFGLRNLLFTGTFPLGYSLRAQHAGYTLRGTWTCVNNCRLQFQP
ncbi:hypothetical protein VCSRO196_3522 [Vibrio cholerae]|nr:hypothetical protein VCSRO196_3522 [Vibrio cholerae]